MLEFWKLALDNLEVAGVGFAIFAMAYISNMSFSLYYATLGVCLSGALKYIMEAFNKMKKILTVKNEAQTVALSAKEKKDGT